MTTRFVDIRQARVSLEVQEGQTILDAALAAGIPYPHGCRSGRCGSCKSRLIEGEVELLQHSRFALSEEEKADGLILACRAVPQTDAAVAWLGSDDDDAVEAPRRVEAIVSGLDDLTHDIKLVRISPVDGSPLLFTAGQYAQVGFDGVPARSYSMANRHGDDSLEFHIRKVPGGVTSQHVHEALKAGDKLTLEFPLGSSYLRQHHSGPILCIAGGSGLAPIKSIVETALAHGMKQPIHVYFGARGARDLYLVEHFETLADRHNNLSFTAVLSDTQVAPHRHGFVTDAVAEDLADFDGWKAYVAGPPPMVDAAMAMAFARGLRPEDMHADVFFTPEGQEG
ncbi:MULTISPECIES: 2Fe-2S iron-sulfur cluster-binding protein [Alphaproteobacteria]|uniref:2Fe-2S iron-sulfur cluster binding domain-containing protein n=8 Tax=Paracoccaceae TaxID=31989 RepID=A0A5C6S2W8_9RHOB|nr:MULTISPECIES: 2Fe-2S iron-sulfur cluster-binding protein [Alphaproteobacteria]AZY95168.1 2Fe-2S iron-sulfur cluster binding domain-containing protein [Paracoccus sp. Arc7-R13]MBP8213964.1 2Fe-2S iron-sulfur cluster binding domain-containing protein [Propionivibrio sp.]TBN46473.1 2Fe-2S iron-sulfur cluster binding domain-containing protein [Paracoccus sediminis]ARC38407.1 oxidoreductase [Paracoccus yeei]MBO6763684.1 2Fe-2S iron-sulfur cluster binding domain-containing protein [Maricaulis sp.